LGFGVWNLKFGVSGLGVRGTGLFRGSSFGFRISGCQFRVWVLAFKVSAFGFISGSGFIEPPRGGPLRAAGGPAETPPAPALHPGFGFGFRQIATTRANPTNIRKLKYLPLHPTMSPEAARSLPKRATAARDVSRSRPAASLSPSDLQSLMNE